MYYFYDSKGNYVGCGGTSDSLPGFTASTIPPVFEASTNKIQSVSMRQARLQLLAINKLSTVADAIASQSEYAKIEWEYASSVDRDNPLTTAIMGLIGFTETQVDDFFEAASKL